MIALWCGLGALVLGVIGGAVARVVAECRDTGESFGEVVARAFQSWSR